MEKYDIIKDIYKRVLFKIKRQLERIELERDLKRRKIK